jgi:hypothetical protein
MYSNLDFFLKLGSRLKFGLIMLCYLTRINGCQCYVFRFCLRVFLINSGFFFSKNVKNWSKSVCFLELKNKISNDKLCNKVLKTLFSWNFGSSRWISLKMENAYSLVCNMWKVHTRPTSASDFFFLILENFQKLSAFITMNVHIWMWRNMPIAM